MRRTIASCGFGLSASVVMGQASLTTIPAQAPWTGTGALVVSASGQVAAGDELGSVPGRAFRWATPGLPGGGLTLLPMPAGAYSTTAQRISADGTVIAGMYKTQSGGPDALVRWTGVGPAELLGALPGGVGGSVDFVSADGSVISGTFYTASSDSTIFRWTAAAGLQDLGVGGVNGMSADGS